MKITEAEWEKRNLGVKTAEITAERNDTIGELRMIQEKLDQEYKYICLKTKTNSPDFIFGLNDLGYTFIETQIGLKFDSNDYCISKSTELSAEKYGSRIAFEFADNDLEMERIIDKIRNPQMFTTDRIFLDPGFEKEKAGIRYYWWCRDSFQRNGKICEVHLDGRAIGIMAYEPVTKKKYKGLIGGIYPEYSDYALLMPAINYLFFQHLMKGGMKLLLSAVSSNNPTIFKMNLASGYQIKDIHYVYVKHIK
mgnify:CR=1 FL=1